MKTDHFVATEEAVLAGLVAAPHHLDEAVEMGLTTADFIKDAHCRVWRAILAIWNANSPLDLISLTTALQREISDLGGYGYLPKLLEADPVGANVLYHVGIVRRRSLVRQLHRLTSVIAATTAPGDGDAESLIESAERGILGLSDVGYTGGAVLVGADIDETIAEIDNPLRAMTGLTTSLGVIDEVVGGLRQSEVTIIGARPGSGKTALMLQMAATIATTTEQKPGTTVFFASLEMSLVEIRRRLLAWVGRVDTCDLRSRLIEDSDITRVMNARQAIIDMPLWVDDTANQRVSRITATARRLKRQHNLGLICIDYIQLVEPEDRKVPRHEQVALISRRLKGLAKDLEVPVVCAAQLNRQSTDRQNNKPKLSDLRESGGIEADADIVMLLCRPDESQQNIIELNIAKNRHGPTAEVTLNFTGKYGLFEVAGGI